jgi:hypothetical protein
VLLLSNIIGTYITLSADSYTNLMLPLSRLSKLSKSTVWTVDPTAVIAVAANAGTIVQSIPVFQKFREEFVKNFRPVLEKSVVTSSYSNSFVARSLLEPKIRNA